MTRNAFKEIMMNRRSWISLTGAMCMVALGFVSTVRAAGQDGLQWKEASPGVSYTKVQEEGPLTFSVARVELERPEYDVTTTIAQDTIFGLSTISSQARSVPDYVGTPLVLMNGDFYKTENEFFAGDPRGIQIMRGELMSAPIGQVNLYFDTRGRPHGEALQSKLVAIWPDGQAITLGLNEERAPNRAVLYTPRLGGATLANGGFEVILERSENGPWLPLQIGKSYTGKVKAITEAGSKRVPKDSLMISIGPGMPGAVPRPAVGDLIKVVAASAPNLAGVQTAIGGGPMLVVGGKVPSIRINKSNERHPRSAVGWNEKFLFFVVADGRQPRISIGVTLPAMGEFMSELGCTDAINMDGGGSAELVVNGRIINTPCYGYERATANAIVVVKKPVVPAASAKPAKTGQD